ncbi:hypothetical protein CALCODRAFT_444593 [Calocera cornea HHB12733]|uniref:Alpha-type protein kinase domain-containing protein n=1 Tax=Calocera cornea HHB12733 TaxID=1353952 RepID=A0A165C9U7_9BASI|nr:hypothetical protein CALCODRAFT_444593 [Calocera cornea HHB12733]
MGRFIPAPSLDFNTLIRTRYKFSIDWLTEGCTAQIIVDERASSCPGPPGSFKTTHPGKFVLYESSMNSDHDQTTAFKVNHREKVVFKRWYVPQAAQAAPNSPEQPDVSRFGAFVRLGKPQEEKMLAGEVTCSVWATALTLLVYRAIQDARSKADPSDLVCRTTFPVVRFVRCGLFRVQLPAPPKDTKRPSRHLTPYLVEELIDTKGDSSNFVKYIHNGSAVPCITTGAEGNIASFLSFCQHLQYVSTGKQVYVSDFQGCNGILTDPQIMTTPELASKVFGDGNVGRAFAAFEAQHICTAYCVAYGLENFLIVPSNDDQPSG